MPSTTSKPQREHTGGFEQNPSSHATKSLSQYIQLTLIMLERANINYGQTTSLADEACMGKTGEKSKGGGRRALKNLTRFEL